VTHDDVAVYLSVITIGELRQGVEKIRHRNDNAEAEQLERLVAGVTTEYADRFCPSTRDGRTFGVGCECRLSRICWISKLAATALIND